MIAEAKSINNIDIIDFKCRLEELNRYCVNLKELTDGLDVSGLPKERALAIMYGAEALEEYFHATHLMYRDMISR
ncbi:MAG: hypothetical protein GX670_03965 [Bacteroidales bacterium]|nr:hypothetical protein [Bacteroidales bacterium]